MTRTTKLNLTAAVMALLLVSVAVLRLSSAAFTGTTDNTGNNWAAGTVTLTDDDLGSALFNATNLAPGDTGSNCIDVTYTGSVDTSAVKLYAALTDTDGLGAHLDMVIERGAQVVDCALFVSAESVYTGTLDGMGTSFATGHGTWAPTGGSNAVVTYKFVWTLGSDTPDTAQGDSVQADFTWEAQS